MTQPETKDLQVDDKISFIVDGHMLDGQITTWTELDKGDISFMITLSDGRKLRVMHRYLILYCKH
jgi:hypothetical protein